jgi:hypothetical protein
MTGCNFKFRKCLLRQMQNVGLTVGYREVKIPTDIQTVCCFAILTVSKAYEDWLMNIRIFYGTRN